MIKQGDVIKHKASLDVAIQVMYASTNPETEGIEVKGIWFNQGQTESYVMNTREYPGGVPAEFVIKKEHVSNWLKCNKPKSGFLRNEEWSELT